MAEAMATKPSKKQLKELKEDCLVESTLKIWFEIGGKRGGVTTEKRKKKGEEEKEFELNGFGLEEEDGKWTPIESPKASRAFMPEEYWKIDEGAPAVQRCVLAHVPRHRCRPLWARHHASSLGRR